jgi:hypothetical protein
VLDDLVRVGICLASAQNANSFEFAPTAELAQGLAELASFYEQHRVEVLQFISRTAISRVRTDAVRTFVRAFREKKER